MSSTEANRQARTAALHKFDTDRLEQSLGRLPKPSDSPAVVVLVGLPGSGKSHLARQIAKQYPAAILDSDALRQILFERPEHTPKEHKRLFPAIHALMGRLLDRGIAVIVDATNIKESSRKPYYEVAKRHGARVVLVRAWAPRTVIYERLAKRESARDPLDRSTATLEVFRKMLPDEKRITRRHISVDTSKDTAAAVDRIIARLQS